MAKPTPSLLLKKTCFIISSVQSSFLAYGLVQFDYSLIPRFLKLRITAPAFFSFLSSLLPSAFFCSLRRLF
jgi:hypothetical protein